MRAGTSSFCPNITQPTAAISTIPRPDHTAYTTPVGKVRITSDSR